MGATLSGAAFGDTGFYPNGVSDSPLAGFPTAGTTFTVLTSGDAELADDANDQEGSGASLGFTDPGRGSANDPTTLGIPVQVPAGNNCLAVDYKFLSEEFPEFVNSGFNDTLVIELDQTTWTVTGETLTAPGDFAAPKGDRVSVDNVGPTTVDPAQSAGTTYDAATAPLTAKVPVAPGLHIVYVSIYDSGDFIFDSAVFLDNVRSLVEDPSTCKPPDLFAGGTGITISASKLKLSGKSVNVPVTCGLQIGLTINCDGGLTLQGALPKPKTASSARAKISEFGKNTYSVAPGATQDIAVKLNGKARKAIGKKGKLKANLLITNASNGATQSVPVTLKGKKKKPKGKGKK